jgi:hypothetical protein
MSDVIGSGYTELVAAIKQRVRAAQYEALRAVNQELVALYWDIGRMIQERQSTERWGRSVVERLAADLRAEFPGIVGFSASNLWRMKLVRRDLCGVRKTRTAGARNCLVPQPDHLGTL